MRWMPSRALGKEEGRGGDALSTLDSPLATLLNCFPLVDLVQDSVSHLTRDGAGALGLPL